MAAFSLFLSNFLPNCREVVLPLTFFFIFAVPDRKKWQNWSVTGHMAQNSMNAAYTKGNPNILKPINL
jgi:hypothetical protein